MPDPSTPLRASQDQTAFSRVCPSCGRRVPRNVAACRCGAELPVESSSAAIPVREESSFGPGAIAAILAGALLLGGAGYWLFLRPAPAAPETAAVVEEVDAPEAAAAPTSAGPSAAARAWDAAANAKEATPSTPAETPAAPPPPPTSMPLSASTEEMVDRVMPAVVLIKATGGRGSGFFVRHDTLITNEHVVEGDSYVTLQKSDGSTVSARVETRSAALDLAILKVATPSVSQAVIPMGTARGLKPGQEIIVIGSALGTLQNSVSRGIVSGLRNSGGATLVQTDAAANPGNSGGPMLDRTGSVIGVTTFRFKDAEGLNFGVAIEHVRDLLEGRQTIVGSARGLSDIQSQSGNASESDRQQQQGEEQFRARIAQMAKAAGEIDGAWSRYRSQCYKSQIPGNYDREWFAMMRGMPNNAAAGCSEYYGEIERAIREYRSLMQRALNDARRANVLPGTVRDLLRQNKLDFDWER
ncbi:MAG TPA: S1C family serine protease [Vicinamibacterales bacterium]